MIHLRLLSTPPRGDAVTFGYRPESVCLEGTYTLLVEYTFRRTKSRRAGTPPTGNGSTVAFDPERVAENGVYSLRPFQQRFFRVR